MKVFSIGPRLPNLIAITALSALSLFVGTAPYARAESADASLLPIRTMVIQIPPHSGRMLAQAASADGSLIVGSRRSLPSGAPIAVRWTAETGVQDLDIHDTGASQAFSVSRDGSALSGAIGSQDGKSQGFRLSKKGGLEKFGSGWTHVETNGLSDDGNVVVGAFWQHEYDPQAFYWTKQEGVQSLAKEPYFQAMKLTDTAALGVSADGSTIVGWAATENRDRVEAFRWSKARGVQYIGDIRKTGFWMGISGDGNVVAGNQTDSADRGAGSKAFRWTKEDGLQNLLPESAWSMALGMSVDGSKVFGTYDVDEETHFFVWTKGQGVRDAGIQDNRYQYLVIDHEIIRIGNH